MPPAARVTDMHTCPLPTHVGGPILPIESSPDVFINGLPAAMVGTLAQCAGPPDAIAKGSTGVFINGRPAARMGDPTVHGGVVIGGSPNVLIGEVGLGGVASPCGAQMSAAKKMGAAYTSMDCSQSLGDEVPAKVDLHWVKIRLVDQDGKAFAPDELHGQTTDGAQHKTEISAGQRFTGIPAGSNTFGFPRFYEEMLNYTPPSDEEAD